LGGGGKPWDKIGCKMCFVVDFVADTVTTALR